MEPHYSSISITQGVLAVAISKNVWRFQGLFDALLFNLRVNNRHIVSASDKHSSLSAQSKSRAKQFDRVHHVCDPGLTL
jgi:hypothetical protein